MGIGLFLQKYVETRCATSLRKRKRKMNKYSVIAETPESTVVSEYQSPFRREANYQSEAELEKAFIEQLQTQAYEYLPITTEQELIATCVVNWKF
jgi:hypothetical protein